MWAEPNHPTKGGGDADGTPVSVRATPAQPTRQGCSEPPEEPPQTSDGFHGLRQGPKCGFVLVTPKAFRACLACRAGLPGGGQLLDSNSVFIRDVVLEKERAGRGAHATRLVQVLECERDAVQPAAGTAVLYLHFRMAGSIQRRFWCDSDKAV